MEALIWIYIGAEFQNCDILQGKNWLQTSQKIHREFFGVVLNNLTNK